MPSLTITTLSGDPQSVSEARISELESDLQGALLRPGERRYESARTIWNAMIDRKPALPSTQPQRASASGPAPRSPSLMRPPPRMGLSCPPASTRRPA